MGLRGSYAKGVAKREEILVTALQLVAQSGYKNTSIRELADAVGLSQAGLLHYFSSKDELFTEILRKRDEVDTAAYIDVPGVTPLGSFELVVAHNTEVEGLVRLYVQLSSDAVQPDHPAHDFFIQRRVVFRELLEADIRERQAAGTARADVDPAQMAVTLLALADGLQVQWLLDPELDMAAHINSIVKLIAPAPAPVPVPVPVSTSDAHAADEFRFLPGDARRVERVDPLPEVDRVTLDTPSGAVSALRFAPAVPPRIVTMHGAGLNAHSFDPFMLALRLPGASLDLPGHGRSDWRDDADYRPTTMAPAVSSAVSQLVDAASPAVLLGHSLGGLTAARVAAAHPELVSHLIVVDITPGISPSSDASSVLEFITGQRSYDSIDEIVDRAIEFGIGHNREALTRGVTLNTRVRSDGKFEWTHHFAHLDALPGAGSADPHPHAALWHDLRSVAQTGIPVTLIRAEQGMVSAALAEEWQRELPGSVVSTLSGPHNLHEAAPRELAETVKSLL